MSSLRLARVLRLSISVACLAASAVVVIAWVRNFWWADVVWAPLPDAGQGVVASADGLMEFGISYPADRWATRMRRPHADWGWQTYAASPKRAGEILVPWKKVIRYRFGRNGNIAVWLPHWLLAIATLLFAAAPWIRWSRRFTIRTLLVITTLVAVVLALATTAGDQSR